MNINITKEKAKFIVNKEKNKVVCIIEDTDRLFIEYATNNLEIRPDCDGSMWARSKLRERLWMPNKFIGIATCSTDDEFDVEKGKLIAFSRAKDKLHASFFKRANIYINSIDEMLTRSMASINRYGAKLEANTERRHKKIESLIGPE